MSADNYDVSKLPKWAQHKIRVLEMWLREKEAKLDELRGNNSGDARVYIGGQYEPDLVLPSSTRVSFKFIDLYITAHIEEQRNALSISTEGGHIGIAAYPCAANVMHVRGAVL